MDARIKGYLYTGLTVVATLVVLRFIAGSQIPVLNTVAKLAVGPSSPAANG